MHKKIFEKGAIEYKISTSTVIRANINCYSHNTSNTHWYMKRCGFIRKR